MRGLIKLTRKFSFSIDQQRFRIVNFITSVNPSLLWSFTFMTGSEEREESTNNIIET